MIASQAAYAGGEDWLNQCVDYIDGNHDFVAQRTSTANIPIDQDRRSRRAPTWCGSTSPAVADKIGAKALAADYNRTKAGEHAVR